MDDRTVDPPGRPVALRTLDASDLAAPPDADLLACFAQSHDPAAYETIVWRHGPRVLAACRQILANEADVEDVFQATFVVFIRRAKTIRNGRALGYWLFGVARRVRSRPEPDASDANGSNGVRMKPR